MRKKKPKPKPKSKGGRPPSDPAKVSLGLKLLEAGEPEEAVKASGVSLGTLYRHKAKRDAAGSVTSPPSASDPIASPAGEQVAALAPAAPVDLEAVREEGRRQARAEDDRILLARDPAAAQKLVDGRIVAAQGEQALVVWLARPIPAMIAGDPLDELMGALGRLKAQFETLPPNSPRAASAATALATLAKGADQIRRNRPEPETEDELEQRTWRVRDETHNIIESTVMQAEAAAAVPAPGAPFGRCVHCESPLTRPLEAAP